MVKRQKFIKIFFYGMGDFKDRVSFHASFKVNNYAVSKYKIILLTIYPIYYLMMLLWFVLKLMVVLNFEIVVPPNFHDKHSQY